MMLEERLQQVAMSSELEPPDKKTLPEFSISGKEPKIASEFLRAGYPNKAFVLALFWMARTPLCVMLSSGALSTVFLRFL